MSEPVKPVTKIQAAMKLHDVPPEKFGKMVRRTISGAVLIAFGVASAALWSFPWYVAATAVGLGAHIWSGQLVGSALKSLIPLIRELVSAIRGTKTEAPTDA